MDSMSKHSLRYSANLCAPAGHPKREANGLKPENNTAKQPPHGEMAEISWSTGFSVLLLCGSTLLVAFVRNPSHASSD
eukprot:scaffold1192_cov169-Amphora_coffeaeformis.AAC.3